jgi:hypothetical protein
VQGTELNFIYVPEATQFACLQIEYIDGTKSAVQKIVRQKSSGE